MSFRDIAGQDSKDDNSIPIGEISDFPEAFVLLEEMSETAEDLDQPALEALEFFGFDRFAIIIKKRNIDLEFLHGMMIRSRWAKGNAGERRADSRLARGEGMLN
jgi:hypothetical protein